VMTRRLEMLTAVVTVAASQNCSTSEKQVHSIRPGRDRSD
jgi:hypothetical protein